jgi:hypothetical protein
MRSSQPMQSEMRNKHSSEKQVELFSEEIRAAFRSLR